MIYAYRIHDFDGSRDWYDLAVLACALDWPEYPIGFRDLHDNQMREDFIGHTRVSVEGAVALVAKDNSRLGDLLGLLIRAEVYELT